MFSDSDLIFLLNLTLFSSKAPYAYWEKTSMFLSSFWAYDFLFQVLVWHTRTEKVNLGNEPKRYQDSVLIEV